MPIKIFTVWMIIVSSSIAQKISPDYLIPMPISPEFPSEAMHLESINMLTQTGENAEAYFNQDGSRIIWQGRWNDNYPADQIWIVPAIGGNPSLVSTGTGKSTCAFFIPGQDRIVYSSTHGHSLDPPPAPDPSSGYVWSLDEYDVYSVDYSGENLRRLTDTEGYDAESAVSPDGKTIVFTSMRDGDLDIYTMDIDGGNVKRLTNTLGYDGGAFFSADGKWIVFRSHNPETEAEIDKYKALLMERKVVPLRFEIQLMKADGTERRQITNLGVASFAPFMHPDGKRIIFCSNFGDVSQPKPAQLVIQSGQKPIFNLYMINVDGLGLIQITFSPTFDGFPMFSADGKQLIWCSNRNGPYQHSTNIFIADWIE